jgi:hypothetical protein
MGTAPVQPVTRVQLGGRRLLLTDLRLAFLFINDARYRAIQRTFGVSREQVNLATVIAVAGLAEALRAQVQKARSAAKPPSAADDVLGLSLLTELLRAIGGPSSPDAPLMGPLIALAVLGAGARKLARKSAHGVYGSSHRMDLAFHHRYGYLIDPGHWRERRARRKEEQRAGT